MLKSCFSSRHTHCRTFSADTFFTGKGALNGHVSPPLAVQQTGASLDFSGAELGQKTTLEIHVSSSGEYQFDESLLFPETFDGLPEADRLGTDFEQHTLTEVDGCGGGGGAGDLHVHTFSEDFRLGSDFGAQRQQ